MTRGGRKQPRDGPERRCVVTREAGPKSGLVRFVADPDGGIVPDVLGKLPGRGIYVAADRAALEAAAAKGHFARAARRPVTTPPDLVARVDAALLRRVQGLLALARKAGQAVAGYEKAKGALWTGAAFALIQASDGSDRQKAKLRPPDGGHFVEALSSREIGLAFGRESVIHAALTAGGLASTIVDEATRLGGVRGIGESGRAAKEQGSA